MSATPDEIVSMAVFARVVEAQSFTAAAHKLGWSKSAVSSRVSRLEEQLGVRLLHRTTRRLSLTDDGLRLYERCARLVAEADQAAEVAAGASDVPRGRLRVAVPTHFADRVLAKPLSDFLARYPDVQLDVRLSDRFVDIVDEGIDVAIRITRRLADSSLIARRLAEDRRVLCASPAYLARRGVPSSPHELVHHDCLRFTVLRAEDEWAFKGPQGYYAVPVSSRLSADDGNLIRHGLLAGLGLGMVPGFLVADEIRSGQLVTVLDEQAALAIWVWAIHGHQHLVPAKVRVFLDHLTDALRVPPWADSSSAPLGSGPSQKSTGGS